MPVRFLVARQAAVSHMFGAQRSFGKKSVESMMMNHVCRAKKGSTQKVMHFVYSVYFLIKHNVIIIIKCSCFAAFLDRVCPSYLLA